MKHRAVYTYRTVPYCGTVFLKIALKMRIPWKLT